MRYGFTTGSCAAAAAKAAAFMLLTGTRKESITIITPKGIPFDAKILDISMGKDQVICAVEKDGGDDPDVTSGARICAKVNLVRDVPWSEVNLVRDVPPRARAAELAEPTNPAEFAEPGIFIDGGEGVGRVTKPGLDQPVGNAAINHVPREMIDREVREVCRLMDFHGNLQVTISVPGGKEIAERTFNPRLGIVGGISIIGTSGIVEPMSTKAILDTIRVELSQRKALGYDYVAMAPGNYGRDYMKLAYGYDIDSSVKCSNFIGDSIDMAAEMGFRGLLLTGHVGKLVKVSGGIMNTHSREGDCRMELMASAAIRCGASAETALQILNCVVTEDGIRRLEEADPALQEATMRDIMDRIMFYLKKRAANRLEIACVMYSNEYGELAKSEGAEKWLTLLAQEQAPLI